MSATQLHIDPEKLSIETTAARALGKESAATYQLALPYPHGSFGSFIPRNT